MRWLALCLAVLAPACGMAGQYEIINPVYRVPPQQQPPAPATTTVPPRIDTSQTCAQPIYPADSRAAHEEGTVDFQLLIDGDGHAADSRIIHSSGHAALDEAARVGLAACRFIPGSVDGKVESLWMTIRYRWALSQ